MQFAVNKAMNIGGKTYVPCVSYEVTRQLEATVAKLVEQGKARTSEEVMVFQNGRLITVAVKEEAKETQVKAKSKATKKDETEGF